MTNCDAQGVRYSVFSFNELASWCNEDLFYGSQARDLSYEDAIQELKAAVAQEVDCEVGEGVLSEDEAEDEIAYRVEERAEHIQIDEPHIKGTLDGIDYEISWLGGAPLVWIIKGLLGFGEQLCSPCVPGAVDGGGGFELATMPLDQVHRDHDGYLCHCPPLSWIRQ